MNIFEHVLNTIDTWAKKSDTFCFYIIVSWFVTAITIVIFLLEMLAKENSIEFPLITLSAITASIVAAILGAVVDANIRFITRGKHKRAALKWMSPTYDASWEEIGITFGSMASCFIIFEWIAIALPGVVPFMIGGVGIIVAYVCILLLARKVFDVGEKLTNHIKDKNAHK